MIGSEYDFLDCLLTFNDGLIIRLKTEWTKRMEELVENYVQLTADNGGFAYNKTPGYEAGQGLRIYLEVSEEKAREAAGILESQGICAELGYSEKMNDTEGGIPITDLEEGIRQVAVVEAILDSAREGREVILEL